MTVSWFFQEFLDDLIKGISGLPDKEPPVPIPDGGLPSSIPPAGLVDEPVDGVFRGFVAALAESASRLPDKDPLARPPPLLKDATPWDMFLIATARELKVRGFTEITFHCFAESRTYELHARHTCKQRVMVAVSSRIAHLGYEDRRDAWCDLIDRFRCDCRPSS